MPIYFFLEARSKMLHCTFRIFTGGLRYGNIW